MDAHSALGPVDPQLGQYPAASIVAAAERPGRHSDQTLILADVSRKAIVQIESFVRRMLEERMEPQRARQVAHLLATGVWTHDHPLQAQEVVALGLPVKIGVPQEERELLELYPQPRGRQSAVEYAPGVPEPSVPARRAVPAGR
jgi:hypothetical protein